MSLKLEKWQGFDYQQIFYLNLIILALIFSFLLLFRELELSIMSKAIIIVAVTFQCLNFVEIAFFQRMEEGI